MLTNAISILTVAAALFGSQAAAKSCHLETTVSHRQNNACGYGSCIPGDTFIGSGVFKIDDEIKWDGDGADYDKLSNGKGVDVDEGGVKFHIDALGIPDAQDKPNCKVHIGGTTNVGTGKAKNIGLPGVMGKDFDCTHDWKC
ncbi:hypothetical protein F4776DRAFT_431600 [Hypoxylon sp. NC0597]|nr:hypothetical protein F4776DRAFT_431600 [Hypoxylon sp. NC0597]